MQAASKTCLPLGTSALQTPSQHRKTMDTRSASLLRRNTIHHRAETTKPAAPARCERPRRSPWRRSICFG